jgi:hypothetical protein
MNGDGGFWSFKKEAPFKQHHFLPHSSFSPVTVSYCNTSLDVLWSPCMWYIMSFCKTQISCLSLIPIRVLYHTVAYRPVAKQWLCKQRPLLGNSSVDTFLLLGSRFLIMQQLVYNNGNRVISLWSMPRCYKQGIKLAESLVEFYTGGCEDRTWVSEAEESPLLEAAAREWPVKTQQAGKCLVGAVVFVNCGD